MSRGAFTSKYQRLAAVALSRALPMLAATSCCCAFASSARAYDLLMCGTDTLGVTGAINFVIESCSMPAGSVDEGDVRAAMAAWNGLGGMADRLSATQGTSTACTFTHGDGQNDLVRVPGTNAILNGANGIAVYVGYTRSPQTCEQNEWDVLLNAAGLNPGAPDELDGSLQPQRGTIVHELGHVLGLGHETAGLNSVMAPSGGGGNTTTGPYGGRTATGTFEDTHVHAPHADDARFGYDRHADGASSTDIAANAWMRSGGSMVLATTPTALTVCDGGTVTNVSWTWHNRGSDDVMTSDWEIVLSTDQVIDNTDMVVLTGTANGTRGFSTSSVDSFVVPEGIGTAAGVVFRVGVIVDPAETIAESIESNNGTRLPLTLTVFSC